MRRNNKCKGPGAGLTRRPAWLEPGEGKKDKKEMSPKRQNLEALVALYGPSEGFWHLTLRAQENY